MKENITYKNTFKLSTIIVIIIITSIISGITAGVIVYTSYNKNTGINYDTINNDPALKQFLEVYSSVTRDYYDDVNKTEMLEAAIDAMLNYLGDNYTTYLDSNQTSILNDSLQGEYQGIGIVLRDHDIIQVFSKSPAAEAGLSAGDKIIKINNQSVIESTPGEMVDLIKASKNSEVAITVVRDEEEIDFLLSTSKLYVPAISYRVLDDTSIGYIRIETFSSTVSNQVEDALEELNKLNVTSIILDVRANSGGYLNAAEATASLFLKKGKVIYTLKTKNETTIVKDKTKESLDLPLVVLIDENTASAAEILAAALKESYGATLVGNTTYGKGKVQQVISLVDGSMAKYTTGKWYTPNNDNVDKKGITPDYVIELDITRDDEGKIININDTQLLKAKELLNK